MISPFIQPAAKILSPILGVISLWLLFRGHNHPGGGFIGALVLVAAYGLLAFSFGPKKIKAWLPFDPRSLMGVGLLVALGAGLFPLHSGQVFFKAIWATIQIPVIGAIKVGTPLFFDLGVYLVVVGAMVIIINAFEET